MTLCSVMGDKLAQLEEACKGLELNSQERNSMERRVWKTLDNFLDDVPNLPVCYPAKLGNLAEMAIGKARDLEKIIQYVEDNIIKSGVNGASGRQMGWPMGGGLLSSSMAAFLSAGIHVLAPMTLANPEAARMEHEVIRWICNELGYPKTALGTFTSGGSIANLAGILAAREAMEITPDKVDKAVVYMTSEIHGCSPKGLKIAGLSTCIVRVIDIKKNLRMNTDLLQHQIEDDVAEGLLPFLVVASAGTTNAGTVDDLEIISNICQKHNLWFHVDGAFGGFFLLVDELKPMLEPMKHADSIALDPHKSMFIQYGCGIVLAKNGKHLYDCFNSKGKYLELDEKFTASDIPPKDLSIELTRPFRGFHLWFPLQLHGVDQFKNALLEKKLLADYFYEKVQEIGATVGPYPDLSVCLFRFEHHGYCSPNAFNSLLLHSVKDDGRICLANSIIKEIVWIRCVVLCYRTHKKEVDEVLEVIAQNVVKLKSLFTENRKASHQLLKVQKPAFRRAFTSLLEKSEIEEAKKDQLEK